jgi:hypothetical protein
MHRILASFHPTARKWVADFQEILDRGDSRRAANALVMMDLKGPDEPFDEYMRSEDVLVWCHEKRLMYNSVFYRLLVDADMLESVRQVIYDDIRSLDAKGFGNIVLGTYGQTLLDSFLTSTPNPNWVAIAILEKK